MVRRQVVVGPGSGLVGAVWLVFVRGVRGKQVCYVQVVRGLCVRLDESIVSGPKGGELATLTLMLHQGRNSGGGCLDIYLFFRAKTSSSVQLRYI